MFFYLKDWFNTKKSEKDAAWAQRVISYIRMVMLPLVSLEEAQRGMEYLTGRQSLAYVEELFQNSSTINLTNRNKNNGLSDRFGQPVAQHDQHKEFMQREMSSVNFKPIPLLTKRKNVNMAEMKKMGPVIDVRATDPTSTTSRKKDEALIKNKKQIERDLSEIYTKMGQPPVKLDHTEARFGDKPSSGNTDEFEKMGLDSDDKSDVNHFMQYFHKLYEEMAAQDVLDYCMTYNQVMEKMENWVNDIWAKNAICGACHISDVTGAPMYDYLAPETVWIYGGGRRKDYNDANAKAYQQKISIKELLDRFGNSFDFEGDWNNLLLAINYAGNNVEFTDIKPSWQGLQSGETYISSTGASYGMNDFYSLKVTVGYIEWSSQNQETFGEVNKDSKGYYFKDNQPVNGERYQSKARFETPTYKAFYLAVSTITQIMFNFGEMTYQQIEGYSDFNVNFSIVTYKQIGDPLAIMAAPFLDVFHEAWYKWKYELRRAKPRGTDYNYDSLIAISEDLFSDQEITREGRFQKILSMMDSSANGLWTFPIGPDGKPVMFTGSQLNPDKPNGLTPEISKWVEVMVTVIDQMDDVLTGKSPLRAGDPGNSRDSMNNQFKALEYSQNATYYVPDMLTFMFQELATKTMLYVQDIIQFKKYNTVPYAFLENAVGEETLVKIMGLGKKAMHRYGIFVESINQSVQRAKLSARIDFALQNGKISNAQALLVEQIKSPTKAYLWLAYFEEKTTKTAQQNALQQQQQQQQGQIAIEKEKQNTLRIAGDYKIQEAQISADANMQSHIITQKGGMTKQAMKHASDVALIEEEAKSDLDRKSQNIDQTGKVNPLPTPAPQMGPQPQGPAPQNQRPVSGIQQSINSAQPVATSIAQ